MASRADELQATRARRQKIFIAAGGIVLVALVGFQLPKLLSSSGSKNAATAPPPAVPLAKPAVPVPTPAEVAAKKSVARLTARDLFVPQVRVAGAATSASPSTPGTLRGPAVREKAFVVKDPFIPQVLVPSAPVAPPSQSAPPPFPDQTKVLPTTKVYGTYIVVLGEIPGTNAASAKAAARAVVAAKNAGLKDIVANDVLGPQKGPKAHFTIFTGPYTTQAGLDAELSRARRNGYPGAYSQRVDRTPTGGF